MKNQRLSKPSHHGWIMSKFFFQRKGKIEGNSDKIQFLLTHKVDTEDKFYR